MKKSLFSMLILFVIGLQSVLAQSREVSGVVTSADDGLSIPGVSVIVKGTTIGTTTDFDGKYSLNVPADGKVLIFSFVGMTMQEHEITSSTINVVMQSESIGMDEVVVVAYGTTTKKSFTGTATQVDADKIESKNASNITQALQGEVAGVQVISNNGQPGSTAEIRIRGIGSINGSRSPLYIVDGTPLQGDINSISPSDIASTTVLKDASATAIYGSRGANGVVIITTKQGKSGKSSIEIDLKKGINIRLLPEYDVFTRPEEYVETAWSALKTRGLLLGNADPAAYASAGLFTGDTKASGFNDYYNMWDVAGDQLIDPATGKFNTGVNRKYSPKRWKDELFQGAQRTEAGIRISGGTDKTTYFTSFSYLDDEGYYLNSDYERFTGRVNIKHEVKSWLKGTMNMSFMNSESNLSGGQDEDSNNGFWLVANMPPLYPVYARDANSNKIEDTVLGGYVYDYGDGQYGTRRFASLTNAVASSTYDVARTTNNQFSGNSKLEATYKDFTFSSTFGLEYLNSSYDNLGNMFWGGSANQGGSIYKRKREWFAFTTTNMLRYAKQFGEHNISAFIAQEASKREFREMSAFKSGLADPWSLELNNAIVSSPSGSYTDELMLTSYFGQILYDFDEKYFFQGVLRRDGSSKFTNDKWGTFGSVGGGWMISRESFMEPTSNFLNELKLKASYGVAGEQGGIGSYDSRLLYEVSNQNDKLALTESHVGNPDLTWEETAQFSIGTEFELFNRISGSVEYYIKNTDNLLFNKRVGPSNGYAIIQVNDGTMENRGLEVILDFEVVKSEDLKVNFGINAAFEKNELTAMPLESGSGEQKVIDVSGLYGRAVGHSLFDIYTAEYAGVDPTNGRAQWNRYYNEVGGVKDYIADMEIYLAQNKGNIGEIGKETTTEYSDATQKFINKTPIPTVRGSFNLDASYKGFSLAALFNYSLGGYGYDSNYAALMDDDLLGSNNWHKDIKNAWKQSGDITDVPAITSGLSGYSDANRTSDRFVTKTDYLSLQSVVLSYSFNKRMLDKLKLKGLKLFVSGDNLWTTTKRKGFYPNASEVGASSRYQYVSLSSITGGINVKF
ncbi:SusC/RagA family TonB-linked outer membrane protein [Labilibaculum filiforme]|uniref:SusC/RagA family TonB-linked outer membrane protein n=1 Tax=Labilibaculum filiforme TaxID=1940526 RepID=A0A2N3I5Q3_9BACT|nr:SusC/RagA family TonB-linked outer membrane protein [Labilibaculum filiforme]PKQ65637.1 SusC/RagA family TonB-linked outer membrane protein [Labilibaculum filiforme]